MAPWILLTLIQGINLIIENQKQSLQMMDIILCLFFFSGLFRKVQDKAG